MIFMVSFFLFIVDVFLLVKFNSILDQAKMEIILGTNPYIISEFLREYLFSYDCIMLIIFFMGAYVLIKKKKLQIAFKMPKGIAYLIIMVSFLGLLSVGYSFIRYGLGGLSDKIIYKSYLVNRVALDIYAAINDLGKEEDIHKAFDNSSERIMSNDSDVPYVIFVLGESADRNKMSAYGYGIKTTPVLDELSKKGEAFVFTDTIAPANYTSRAMELIFTYAEKGEKNYWYENQNLIDIVKMAGYRTVWLSNQSPVGKFGNTDRILANRSDYSKFTNVAGGEASSLVRPLDESLLPLLDEAMSGDSFKNFYVLHIEGSHEQFNLRYPDRFAKFATADEDSENYLWNKTKAEYDNTILYTDFIIGETIKRFADKNAVLVYISDHGNEVYDGKNFVGHSGEEKEIGTWWKYLLLYGGRTNIGKLILKPEKI